MVHWNRHKLKCTLLKIIINRILRTHSSNPKSLSKYSSTRWSWKSRWSKNWDIRRIISKIELCNSSISSEKFSKSARTYRNLSACYPAYLVSHPPDDGEIAEWVYYSLNTIFKIKYLTIIYSKKTRATALTRSCNSIFIKLALMGLLEKSAPSASWNSVKMNFSLSSDARTNTTQNA